MLSLATGRDRVVKVAAGWLEVVGFVAGAVMTMGLKTRTTPTAKTDNMAAPATFFHVSDFKVFTEIGYI